MKQELKVFLVRAGRNGEDEDLCLENGLSVIGFREVGSLDNAKDFNAMLELVTTGMPDLKKNAAGNFARQLWAYAVSMKEGDIVVMPRKLTSQIALGKVTSPYKYQKIGGEYRHTRKVNWIKTDLSRSVFKQDMLYSLGAFMTVCNISRNNAEQRIAAILAGKADPGYEGEKGGKPAVSGSGDENSTVDLAELAHDQIVKQMETRFKGHALARLVDALLRAEGWVTRLSPPGADGGVDIFGGRGSLGLNAPRLCVQVKSQSSPADVTVYRTLQGSMQTFKAEQGLLVCWGGFNRAVVAEAKQAYFSVRLWESRDLVEAVYRNYEQLPAEIQADLPLKKVWMLVLEDET